MSMQRNQFYPPNPYQQWYPHQWAQGYPGQANTHPQSQMYRQITIEDAIRIARERMPGEVVKVELEREHGRLVYEVEVISTQGPKYELDIDAMTGEIIEIKLD